MLLCEEGQEGLGAPIFIRTGQASQEVEHRQFVFGSVMGTRQVDAEGHLAVVGRGPVGDLQHVASEHFLPALHLGLVVHLARVVVDLNHSSKAAALVQLVNEGVQVV